MPVPVLAHPAIQPPSGRRLRGRLSPNRLERARIRQHHRLRRVRFWGVCVNPVQLEYLRCLLHPAPGIVCPRAPDVGGEHIGPVVNLGFGFFVGQGDDAILAQLLLDLHHFQRVEDVVGPHRCSVKGGHDAYVANLPLDQQAMLPLANSLPEIMVGIGLLLGGYQFTYQSWDNGGRLVLGGAVVDFQVSLGAKVVVIRVQGDYWHSLPVRVLKDVAQFDLLKARGYLVWDAWEHAIYQAWLDGRIENFVREGIDTAI